MRKCYGSVSQMILNRVCTCTAAYLARSSEEEL
jgi:hypothetical protein